MYSKVTPVKTLKSVESLVRYIGDASHRNHHDKVVEPIKFWHANDVASGSRFALFVGDELSRINALKKRGAKIVNLGDHEIVRSPDFADLSAAERELIENRIMAAFPDAPAVSAWHIDKGTGSCDLHIFRANFAPDMPGKARRQSGNPIRYMRTVCDAIHDELNLERSKTIGRHIETMPEIHQRKLKEKGLLSLGEQLSQLQAVDWAELPTIITKLGHIVTRYNRRKKTISVLFKKGCKACRYDIEKLQDEVSRNRFYENFVVPSEDDFLETLPDLS